MACDSYTVAMLHMNGADGSTTFSDSSLSPHTFTTQGDAQIDTAQFVFGGASGLFDGTGDYITSVDSPDWDFGTGDFTIDFRVRWNGTPGVVHFIGRGGDTTQYQIEWTTAAGGLIQGHFGGTSHTSAWSTNVGDTWYHVAFIRSGTVTKFFINGTQLGLDGSNSADVTYATPMGIGANSDGTRPLNGWLDEFRISKGIARWTSNFTPPTQEYCLGGGFTSRLTLLGVG